MPQQLFTQVFKKDLIYNALFLNVKSVLEYPTLEKLKESNEKLYLDWVKLSKLKYENKYNNVSKDEDIDAIRQSIYEEYAVKYPEFCRIVSITMGTVFIDGKSKKKALTKFVNDDEFQVIQPFMEILYQLSSDGVKSTPQYFPSLCGYDIISYDIPFLIKRFLIHRDKFENNKELPLIIKKILDLKPWEEGIVDIANIWKFNGYENESLLLISDFLNLKRNVEILSPSELSKYYWNNIKEKPVETLNFIVQQSIEQNNIVIQLINLLRQL